MPEALIRILEMGGHGPWVWSAYAAALLVLGLAWLGSHRLFQRARERARARISERISERIAEHSGESR
ncbi:MAG: heme exporter protein CcmD [Gammaproteobacteria bacterium AqS3]|nr:heme exporter protein CcmD [Gammaproteobacteria bacterium AqS3]